ncbi:hypothetical protein FUAX_39300 (plasmid) [Fulvitalea axinellae]|uniref:Uncharacterized protein n=1 Tax=Fulvitalea axinellae TaxID=1182444 RepID=A0AAU9D658_9BACT|nr:hypothetical protein FUAX_39300 [Fulvitalea axinellae]
MILLKKGASSKTKYLKVNRAKGCIIEVRPRCPFYFSLFIFYFLSSWYIFLIYKETGITVDYKF